MELLFQCGKTKIKRKLYSVPNGNKCYGEKHKKGKEYLISVLTFHQGFRDPSLKRLNKERFERDEEVSHAEIWRKKMLGRKKQQVQRPWGKSMLDLFQEKQGS